jgi:hypothetical protein
VIIIVDEITIFSIVAYRMVKFSVARIIYDGNKDSVRNYNTLFITDQAPPFSKLKLKSDAIGNNDAVTFLAHFLPHFERPKLFLDLS